MAIYVADFETTTSVVSKEKTKVWGGAIVNIEDYADDSKVVFFKTIDDFFEMWEIRRKDGFSLNNKDVVFFHNLKFDGSFILSELLNCGYKHTEDNTDKLYKGKHVSSLISDMGTWYQIKVQYYGIHITIKNSLCLVASSVAEMGDSFKTKKRKLDMDYDESSFHEELTDEDKKYMAADVQIPAEVLHTLINDFNFKKLTAGANSLAFFKEHFGGNKKFRAFFPSISKEEENFIRASYKGGWCYVSKLGHKISSKEIRARNIIILGSTYDVNSLYPSMMHSISGNIFPVGDGEYFDCHHDFEPEYDYNKPLWIAKFRIMATLKPNKFPCVQIKGSSRFQENEWLEELALEDGAPVELTVTSVDWELIKETYDVYYCECIEGYRYAVRKGLFDSFIDYWYEIKRNSKGAKKQLAKIILNSFYGKFGTKTVGCSKIPYLSDDGVLKFKKGEKEERKGVYLPVACFTTAYARSWTIRAADANYERFCYADTDSIHILGWEPPKDVRVHKSDMCAWKCEGKWDDAKFLRQKTYMEHIVRDENDNEKDEMCIKCAGMPESIKYKKEMKEDEGKIVKVPQITFDDFELGATWETGKLEAKQVKGGVLLLEKPFTIRT